MRRYVMTFIAAGSVMLSFLPSHAARYTVEYGAMRGASISVKLAGGGTATATLTYFDVVRTDAEGLGRTVPSDEKGYVGCISIKTKLGSDKSCSILTGAAVTLDPALSTIGVSFSVDSGLMKKQSPPIRIIANLILTGEGAPFLKSQPSETHSYKLPKDPVVIPSDPGIGNLPKVNHPFVTMTAQSGPQIGRAVTVKGSIKSEGLVRKGKSLVMIGGGAVTKTLKGSEAWYGTGGKVFVIHP